VAAPPNATTSAVRKHLERTDLLTDTENILLDIEM
jgi:hypothetical protein